MVLKLKVSLILKKTIPPIIIGTHIKNAMPAPLSIWRFKPNSEKGLDFGKRSFVAIKGIIIHNDIDKQYFNSLLGVKKLKSLPELKNKSTEIANMRMTETEILNVFDMIHMIEKLKKRLVLS